MKGADIVALLVVVMMMMVARSVLSEEDQAASNVLDEVTMSRKSATDFHKYRRWFWPDLAEECYKEGCSREEVHEHFSSKQNAVRYWNTYRKWCKMNKKC